MANRKRARAGVLRLCGVLLLTFMATASARAQIEGLSPGFPLSTGLAPSLTDDPQTAPVTTLATDLLAPQRPYIFDPSGSSIVSNALNPTIYSSSFSLSLVTTDTQIRDSSQAGHLSPYTAAGQRLGLSFSGSADPGSQDNRSTTNGSFRGALTGETGSEPSATGNAYQSSWGGASSFGPLSEESSWGTGRMGSDRLGNKQPNSLAATRIGLATAGDSSGSAPGNAAGLSANGIGIFAGRSSGGSSNGSVRMNSSPYGSTNGVAKGTHTEGQYSIAHKTSSSSRDYVAAMNGPPGDNEVSAKHTLAFFPQASYNQSILGASPFSSPAGGKELHFLNPSIYAATSQGRSLSIGEKGSASGDSLRQAFVRRDHPSTHASRYGLNTHLGADRPAKINGEKSELEKQSHLSNGLLNSKLP